MYTTDENLCVCVPSVHTLSGLTFTPTIKTPTCRGQSPSNGKIEHYIKASTGYEPLYIGTVDQKLSAERPRR